MDLAPLAEHVAPAAGAVTVATVILKRGPDAVLRLVAGLTAIAAKDDNSSRAERALAVLRTLRKDDPPPPPGTESTR